MGEISSAIAQAVLYALCQAENIDVNEVIVHPTANAFLKLISRKGTRKNF
ncbi:hypothetical protein H6G27_30495 [Nostoc linckia FACHB-104]|nr:hypothetical protein [Nostoc linckia FACHB-104]